MAMSAPKRQQVRDGLSRVLTARKLAAKRAARSLVQCILPPTHHFIHIPKNGGLSVRAALGYRVSLSEPYFHYRYRDLVDDRGTNVKYFTVVRNPWSRTASRYLYSKQFASRWSDPRGQYIKNATFEDFVRDQRMFEIPEHPGQPWMGPMTSWYNQLEWIEDENGNVVCDCLRLEHIDSDLSAYFGRRMSVPHRNVSPKQNDYRQMYTDSLAELVAELFRQDIEYFGFAFESAANRNIAV